MNKLLLNVWGWYEDHKIDVNDIGTVILTILVGNFIKMYREPESPNKWRPSRFISEFLISSLIALTFYEANTLWLHLPYLFTLIICVWLGSLSSRIYAEMDELLSWSFESLKTYVNKKFLSTIAIVLVGLLATGCSKKPVATNIQSIDKKEITNTLKEREIVKTQAIIDSLKIAIFRVKTNRPECDSIANQKIDELLQRLNSKKTSGNNNFGVYFDELKRELVAYANVGETQSEKIKELENKLLSEINKKQETKPVQYIPEWVKYLALFGLLTILYIFYKIYKSIVLWVSKKSLPLV